MGKQTKFDWQEMQALAFQERRILALTDVGALIILACADFYNQRFRWEYGSDEVTDTQWDEISEAIGTMEDEIMSGLVGVILPHALNSIADLAMLPCDGSTYLRVNYPKLYAVLDEVYIVDADTFIVPDLREKFPLGESINFGLGDTGGEVNHTLTEAEMPIHAHSYTQPTFGVDIESVGIPDPTGVGNPPIPQTTGTAGGGEPHNNMPPFVAIRWGIVSG